MKISEIIAAIEEIAPLRYQESYDNAGLIVGNMQAESSSALLCVDVTEAVIDEAISKKINLIISHHPVIFKGLKRLTESSPTEKIVAKAIKNDIALYAAHTNIDNVANGVNAKICEKMRLSNSQILLPRNNELCKIIVYVPIDYAEKVRSAMFAADAGNIGNYSNCSFNVNGQSSFCAGENTRPFVGKKGKLHFENETKIETIVQKNKLQQVIAAIKKNHPYEEAAYDIYNLENDYTFAGSGMIGNLPAPVSCDDFFAMLKKTFSLKIIRATKPLRKKIFRVAVCGGAGFFLLGNAIANKADAFVTADLKYHDFFAADGKILIADIGHFESEQFTIEIFCDILKKKLYNFAPILTKEKTNPIYYII